jgi:hypothetical protein
VPKAKGKWTLLVYLAGNNSLSGAAADDLKEMRKVGSTNAVKVLAFLKQRGKKAFRFEVKRDGKGEKQEALGDVDSGDPQTVVDFIRWGVKQAPAERYALVVWNHGGGWEPDDLDQLYKTVRAAPGSRVTRAELNRRAKQRLGRSIFSTTIKTVLARPTAAERQIANDDGSGHSLDTLELGNVLAKATAAIGRPLDLFGMDACLMSTLEVAYQIRDHTRFVVGSEELEPGAGWCYDRILAKLGAMPSMTPLDLAKTIVTEYVDSYRKRRSDWPVSQSALQTSALEGLGRAVDALGKALQPVVRRDLVKVFKAHKGAARFDFLMCDVQTFCRQLVAQNLGPEVTAAAKAVSAALAPGDCVVAEGHLGNSVEGCGGVTLYLPPPLDAISKYYKDLDFAKKHGWDEFLRAYHAA